MIPHRVFLDLFAGTAPVGRKIAEMGYAVLEFDVANGAAADLSCRRTQDQLVGWMKAGLVWGLWLATPCVTLTRARRDNTAGLPRPLRSSDLPHGLPGLTAAEQAQVREANKLIAFAGRLLALASRLGVIAGEENPSTSILWCFRIAVNY